MAKREFFHEDNEERRRQNAVEDPFMTTDELMQWREDLVELQIIAATPVTVRTPNERLRFDAIRLRLKADFVRLFRSINKHTLAAVESLDFIEEIMSLADLHRELEDMRVPELKTEMTEYDLKAATAELAGLEQRVYDATALLKAQCLKLDAMYGRLEDVLNAMSVADNKWKSSALLQLVMDEKVVKRKVELDQVLGLAESRLKSIEGAWNKLSRYISVHIAFNYVEPDLDGRADRTATQRASVSAKFNAKANDDDASAAYDKLLPNVRSKGRV